MSAQALLKRFDIVADQSANIPALRRLVVDLAVRGKLLRTEELDIDVQEMLGRISAKANELALAGLIKKQKPLSKIGNDEVPAAYLAHCAFARLGSIANLQKGLTGIQSSTPGEYPLVATAAERGTCDHFDLDGSAAIIPLVSSTGHGNASINRLHYQEGKFALGTILCAVLPFDEQLISARFLYEYLTAFKEELLVSKMIGTANVTLTLGKIAEVPVPILAPSVQRRVDELMALCDQLEAAQQERERRRDRLATASLQRLNQPAADTAPEAQREHARFHLHHLPRLTTRPEHIKAIRNVFLNLAIRGKLLKQLNTEGRAQDALAAAFDIRRMLVKKGQLAQKWLTVTAWLDDEPFELPAQWAAAGLDHLAAPVANALKAGPFGSALKKEFYAPTGFKIYGQEQVIGQDAHLGDYYIDEAKYLELQSCAVKPGDLLISLVGTIGKVLILPPDCEAGIINPRLIKMTLNRNAISAEYVSLLLQAPWVRNFLFAKSHGTTMDVLNLTILRSLPVPVPPLAEQHRIVAKVDELMALCDQLEAQLSTIQTDSCRLLEAVLEAALTPALLENLQ